MLDTHITYNAEREQRIIVGLRMMKTMRFSLVQGR